MPSVDQSNSSWRNQGLRSSNVIGHDGNDFNYDKANCVFAQVTHCFGIFVATLGNDVQSQMLFLLLFLSGEMLSRMDFWAIRFHLIRLGLRRFFLLDRNVGKNLPKVVSSAGLR